MSAKPLLSPWQIVNMNVGFLGIQFSFGLQQANMSPIYQMLGADGKTLPLLWLAGPVTGLIVQPLVGAFSDNSSRGSKTPAPCSATASSPSTSPTATRTSSTTTRKGAPVSS